MGDDEGIELRKCAQCGVMQSHLWREGPDGRKSLCNSCGLKYKKQQELLDPHLTVDGPRKRQPSARLIEEVSAAAAATMAAPMPITPAQRTQVTRRDMAPVAPLPKALVQSQLGTRIPISATTGYTFEEKFTMTYKPEPPPLMPDEDEFSASDERLRDPIDPPAEYAPIPLPTPALPSADAAAVPAAATPSAPVLSTADQSVPASTNSTEPAPMEVTPAEPAHTPAAAAAFSPSVGNGLTNGIAPAVPGEPDAQSEILIVVRLDLPTPSGQRVQESLIWNLNEQLTTPEDFAHGMCADMQLQEGCRRTIAAAIRASCERYAPLRHYKETAEDIRVIRLAMMVGAVSLRDQFEWDINNPTNSPEMFARSMCVDLGLPREFEVSIAAAIRAQVQEYRLAALQGRAIGRSVSAGFALRSDKELPAWTPQLSVQKDLRRRVQEPLTAGAPAASGMLSTTSLRPRGVTSGQMQMLTPESFRRDGGGGAGSQSSSNKVVYTLRT